MSAEDLLSTLEKVRRTGPGRWQACCPAHADKTASLLVTEKPDGKTTIHCFAMCSPLEVLDAVGLKWDALFPPKSETYDYRPPDRQQVNALDALKASAHEAMVGYLIFSDIYKLMRRADLNPQHMASIGLSVENLDRLGLVVDRLNNAIELATGANAAVAAGAQRIIDASKLRPEEEQDLEDFLNHA
jgi:hypothetical protein